MIKHYRVEFLKNIEVDYWGNNKKKLQAESYLNFKTLHEKYYPIIKKIKQEALNIGIRYTWHFYEPHIEITFLAEPVQAENMFNIIKDICKENNINDLEKKYPETDWNVDWFCCNGEEMEFGGKRHAACSDLVYWFDKYKDGIEKGKGINEQVKRTIHTLCNPLGINYIEESKICFSRGLICVLFRFFSFKKSVWIYKNIFRQKY